MERSGNLSSAYESSFKNLIAAEKKVLLTQVVCALKLLHIPPNKRGENIEGWGDIASFPRQHWVLMESMGEMDCTAFTTLCNFLQFWAEYLLYLCDASHSDIFYDAFEDIDERCWRNYNLPLSSEEVESWCSFLAMTTI